MAPAAWNTRDAQFSMVIVGVARAPIMTVMTIGELYVNAMNATSAHLDAVHPEQWQNATPCTEWNVRDIANHIIGENLWAVELLNGKTIAQVGQRLDGDLAGDDPAAAYQASVRAATTACTAPGAMDATCHLSFGDYSGSDYAGQPRCTQ